MPTQTIQQDLIKELGIDELPPEKQEEILVAMTELLLKRITVLVLEKLSEEQRQEFDTMAADGDPEKVTNFFSQNVPGYEQLVQDEITKFKGEMKETMDALLAA